MEKQTNICVLVGPNGNLTTLFAALASLHPEVVGFEHGFEVMNYEWLEESDKPKYFTPHPVCENSDFLFNYSPERVDNFIKNVQEVIKIKGIAVKRQRTGTDNRFDMLTAHAFTRKAMQEAFNELYPNGKPEIEPKCIFWKEGMMLTKHLWKHNVNLEDSLIDNRIRFFIPLRNPIHTYYSCKYKGFFNTMREPNGDPLFFIMNSLKWVYDIASNPKIACDKFALISETELNNEYTFEYFAKIMGVSYNEDWIKACLKASELKAVRSYTNEPDLKIVIKRYETYIKDMFEEDEDFTQELLNFKENI